MLTKMAPLHFSDLVHCVKATMNYCTAELKGIQAFTPGGWCEAGRKKCQQGPGAHTHSRGSGHISCEESCADELCPC